MYYLREYLENRIPIDNPNEAFATDEKQPFYKNGECFVFLASFKKYIKEHFQFIYNQWNQDLDLSSPLKIVGCEMVKMDFRPECGDYQGSLTQSHRPATKQKAANG